MNINVKDFQVPEGEKVKLEKWPTLVEPVYKPKKKYHKLLKEQVEELSSLQRLHYASNRYALLLIFQAAGKDGAIRHVMSGVNPQGCQVFSLNTRVLRNWITIFYGAPPSVCRNAAGSAFSIALTTRRY